MQIRSLSFNRFNLHVVGKEKEAKIQEIVELEPKSAEHYKILTLYHAFHTRNQAFTTNYAKKWLEMTEENTLDHAEATSYLAYANAMDGGYKDPSLFAEAHAAYEQLEKKALSEEKASSDLRSVQLGKAFTSRYLALLSHRCGKIDDALNNINEAIEIQRRYKNSFPDVAIDLAESIHIHGVIQVRQNKLADAEKDLLEAAHLWESVHQKTGHYHIIHFNTMQSLADVYRRQQKYAAALNQLEIAERLQQEHYLTDIQVDIAKTQHFKGETYEAMGQWDYAIKAFKQALYIKSKLSVSTPMLQVTLHALANVANKSFYFDWNDFQTIKLNEGRVAELEKIVAALTSKIAIFDAETKTELGRLCYKLGAYYLHVKRDPTSALTHLQIAENFLIGDELAWTHNQLAYVYQQKLFSHKKNHEEKEKLYYKTNAEHYYQLVLKQYQNCEESVASNELNKIRILAFAYCVQALSSYEMGQLDDAIVNYSRAIGIYEKYKLLDDQYARAMNRYALFLAEQGKNYEARNIFEKLQHYWINRGDQQDNPYAARFYTTYADFLYKNCRKPGQALPQYEMAYSILQRTDGVKASITIDVQKQITDIKNQSWRSLAIAGATVAGAGLFLAVNVAKHVLPKASSASALKSGPG